LPQRSTAGDGKRQHHARLEHRTCRTTSDTALGTPRIPPRIIAGILLANGSVVISMKGDWTRIVVVDE
jgi:hypothetical protein